MAERIPTTLPQPLISSYSGREGVHYRANETQAGSLRYEKISDAAKIRFKVSWNFTAFDFQAFEAWFTYSIDYGVDEFIIPMQVGMGIEDHTCRFDGTYDFDSVGKRFIVNATLISNNKEVNIQSSAEDVLLLHGITKDVDVNTFFNSFVTIWEDVVPEEFNIKYGTDFS